MSSLGVVLAAAGSSRRLGFDKLFTPVLGKTVFQFTLERLLASPDVAQVVVATSAENLPVVQGFIAAPHPGGKPVTVVAGGAERQDSVMAGLKALDPALDYVLIQDAARPFLSPELIASVFAAAREHGAAVCGHPSIDTLKEVSEEGGDVRAVARTLDRSRIWAVQTPQIFRRSLLVEAYAHVAATGGSVTDDTAAVEALGKPVVIVKSEAFNGKITRKADWDVALRQLFPFDDDVQIGAEMRKLIHDFNNQLTSLMGFAYLLDCDCPEDSPMKSSITAVNEAVTKCHEISLALQKRVREFHTQKTAFSQSLTDPDGVTTPVSPLAAATAAATAAAAAHASPVGPVASVSPLSPLAAPVSPLSPISPVAPPASPISIIRPQG